MLKRIFNRTNGRCHITGKTLTFNNYGRFGAQGAWEISANRAKDNGSTRAARAEYGLTRAPFSQKQVSRAQESNAWVGLFIGGLMGLVFGPIGVGIGAACGAVLGNSTKVE